MRLIKKEFKSFLEIAKKLAPKEAKKRGKKAEEEQEPAPEPQVLLQAQGEKAIIRAKRGDVIFVGEMKNLDPESKVSFVANLHDLDAFAGGRDKEIELEADEEQARLKGTEKSVPAQPFKNKAALHIEGLRPFKEPRGFLSVLKRASESLHESERHECTKYLKIYKGNALMAFPQRVYQIAIAESFDFKTTHLDMGTVSFLAKHLNSYEPQELAEGDAEPESGYLYHAMQGDKLVIKDGGAHYLIKINEKMPFPPLMTMRKTADVCEFEIDADLVKEFFEKHREFYEARKKEKPKAAELKKIELKKIAVEHRGNELIFDPQIEGYEAASIPVTVTKGALPEGMLFESEALLGFFEAHEGVASVVHQMFVNVYGKEGEYRWSVNAGRKISMVSGIHKPNGKDEWERIFGENGILSHESDVSLEDLDDEEEEE